MRGRALQGLAGTNIVEVPSVDGLAKPVDELAGSSAMPWTDSGVAAGDDCPVIGGDEAVVPEPGLPTPVAPPMTPQLSADLLHRSPR